LQQAGIVTAKSKRLFEGFTLELQAEINSEILSLLHDAELSDWARYGKVRQGWEKYLRGSEPKRRKNGHR
jgi:hypothetical protein